MRLVMHTDGGSRGNPGPAAWAYTADIREHQFEASGVLGHKTNNFAEHRAMMEALKFAWDNLRFEFPDMLRIEIFSDSKLIVEQVNRRWQVKHPELEDMAITSQAILNNFREAGIVVNVQHVRREFNEGADALVNLALDKHEQ